MRLIYVQVFFNFNTKKIQAPLRNAYIFLVHLKGHSRQWRLTCLLTQMLSAFRYPTAHHFAKKQFPELFLLRKLPTLGSSPSDFHAKKYKHRFAMLVFFGAPERT